MIPHIYYRASGGARSLEIRLQAVIASAIATRYARDVPRLAADIYYVYVCYFIIILCELCVSGGAAATRADFRG